MHGQMAVLVETGHSPGLTKLQRTFLIAKTLIGHGTLYKLQRADVVLSVSNSSRTGSSCLTVHCLTELPPNIHY